MSTELFTAHAANDGRKLAIELDHHLRPETCYDKDGNPFTGYKTHLRIADGHAVAEATAEVPEIAVRRDRDAFYGNVGDVLRGLGVDIPAGWRSHELPPGMVL